MSYGLCRIKSQETLVYNELRFANVLMALWIRCLCDLYRKPPNYVALSDPLSYCYCCLHRFNKAQQDQERLSCCGELQFNKKDS
jgi:hypothetical protein